MVDNRRDHLRVSVASGTDVYVTIHGGLIRNKVLDLSDGGACFLSLRKLPAGENEQIELHFPWLTGSIEVTIKVVRAIEVVLESEEEAKPEASEEEEVEETPEKETKKAWAIASRFVAMTMGQEDRLFREVRRLERELIAAAKNDSNH